ncbi:hypothetical protein TNCV_4261231 [Trichonephila clavipes]|nr:hypothetical protein TNCV_4261231 [Trichonephila clavipes]
MMQTWLYCQHFAMFPLNRHYNALGSLASLPNGKEIWILSYSRSAMQHLSNWQTCSRPRVPRAHQAGFSRRSLAGVGLSESVRCHGPGLALLTNGGVQQQQIFVYDKSR